MLELWRFPISSPTPLQNFQVESHQCWERGSWLHCDGSPPGSPQCSSRGLPLRFPHSLLRALTLRGLVSVACCLSTPSLVSDWGMEGEKEEISHIHQKRSMYTYKHVMSLAKLGNQPSSESSRVDGFTVQSMAECELAMLPLKAKLLQQHKFLCDL